MGKSLDLGLQRNLSVNSPNKTVPAASGYHARSPSSIGTIPEHQQISDGYNLLNVPCRRCTSAGAVTVSVRNPPNRRLHVRLTSFLRSLINNMNVFSMPTCKFLALPSSSSTGHVISLSAAVGRRKVTGTLYGHRRGQVTFAVQHDPRSDPVLLLDLALSTSSLVKEMSSGLVRIALECEKRPAPAAGKLFQEPVWTMYCNGRKCGYAAARSGCTDTDRRVLGTVSRVSVGAGVIPGDLSGGEDVMYMRARFERVVGSVDSEAFYMLNPDKTGGPELSIFLLRI